MRKLVRRPLGSARRAALVVACLALLISALGLPDWDLLPDAPTRAHASGVLPHACESRAALARAQAALAAAQARYRLEWRGRTIHVDLSQIAHDPHLLSALATGDAARALVAANHQLVRHVVRIRVLRGSRAIVDANPTSFDVGGSATALRSPRGRALGTLEITVQDVIGFIKLVHKLDHAEVVVRSASGEERASLPLPLPLPAGTLLARAGCTSVRGHRYVLRSFSEPGFAGPALTIWLLTPA